ncbi:hypothetical protein A3Q56_00163 [Intoshia linei]|uniref:Uncharacterized protein n=1 Tax=Intoshia linei TaxID=1819745 RepID=A0A177BES1_9BILA|nr:hypothetical protein A3Q56_00163 [Intoshia linei]
MPNKFKFLSFNKQLSQITVSNLNLNRFEEFNNKATIFINELEQQTELYKTKLFVEFKKNVSPKIKTLPQLIFHKCTVFDYFIKSFEISHSESIKPILRLVCRDYSKNSDILESILQCLVHVFKYLWKSIYTDLPQILNVVSNLLNDSIVRKEIVTFSAQSIAYVLKKSNFDCSVIENVLTFCDDENLIFGVSCIFSESIRGVCGGFYSNYQRLFDNIFSYIKIDTEISKLLKIFTYLLLDITKNYEKKSIWNFCQYLTNFDFLNEKYHAIFTFKLIIYCLTKIEKSGKLDNEKLKILSNWFIEIKDFHLLMNNNNLNNDILKFVESLYKNVETRCNVFTYMENYLQFLETDQRHAYYLNNIVNWISFNNFCQNLNVICEFYESNGLFNHFIEIMHNFPISMINPNNLLNLRSQSFKIANSFQENKNWTDIVQFKKILAFWTFLGNVGLDIEKEKSFLKSLFTLCINSLKQETISPKTIVNICNIAAEFFHYSCLSVSQNELISLNKYFYQKYKFLDVNLLKFTFGILSKHQTNDTSLNYYFDEYFDIYKFEILTPLVEKRILICKILFLCKNLHFLKMCIECDEIETSFYTFKNKNIKIQNFRIDLFLKAYNSDEYMLFVANFLLSQFFNQFTLWNNRVSRILSSYFGQSKFGGNLMSIVSQLFCFVFDTVLEPNSGSNLKFFENLHVFMNNNFHINQQKGMKTVLFEFLKNIFDLIKLNSGKLSKDVIHLLGSILKCQNFKSKNLKRKNKFIQMPLKISKTDSDPSNFIIKNQENDESSLRNVKDYFDTSKPFKIVSTIIFQSFASIKTVIKMDLESFYLEKLESGNMTMQKYALDCLTHHVDTFKVLKNFSDKFNLLLGEKWKSVLVVFNPNSEVCFFDSVVRSSVMFYVLRILKGKLVSKNFKSSFIIFKYMRYLDDTEMLLFLKLYVKSNVDELTFSQQQAITTNLHDLVLKNGFLLNQPVLERLLDIFINVLHQFIDKTHKYKEKTKVSVIRKKCLNSLLFLFKKKIKLNWSNEMITQLFNKIIIPLIYQFNPESESMLYQFIQSWCKNDHISMLTRPLILNDLNFLNSKLKTPSNLLDFLIQIFDIKSLKGSSAYILELSIFSELLNSDQNLLEPLMTQIFQIIKSKHQKKNQLNNYELTILSKIKIDKSENNFLNVIAKNLICHLEKKVLKKFKKSEIVENFDVLVRFSLKIDWITVCDYLPKLFYLIDSIELRTKLIQILENLNADKIILNFIKNINSTELNCLKPNYQERFNAIDELINFFEKQKRHDHSTPSNFLHFAFWNILFVLEKNEESSLNIKLLHVIKLLISFIFLFSIENYNLIIFLHKNLQKNMQDSYKGAKTYAPVLQHMVMCFIGSKNKLYSNLTFLQDYSFLLNENDNLNFFSNITSIQGHRHAKALALLGRDLDSDIILNLSVQKTLRTIVGWFIWPAINLKKNKINISENQFSVAVNTFKFLCNMLSWKKYSHLLHKTLKLLVKSDSEKWKMILKLISSIIDGFTKTKMTKDVVNYFKKFLLPLLHEILVKTISVDKSHKLSQKSKSKSKLEIKLKAPVAYITIKLLKLLPPKDMYELIPYTMQNVINILKSRSLDVREWTRKLLTKMISLVGVEYFNQFLLDLSSTLNRGYLKHILLYTIHSILKHLDQENKNLNLLTFFSIEKITNLHFDLIFSSGETHVETDIPEEASHLFEYKKDRCLDTFSMLIRFSSKETVQQLLCTLKCKFSETQNIKIIDKLVNISNKICYSLMDNPKIEIDTIYDILNVYLFPLIPIYSSDLNMLTVSVNEMHNTIKQFRKNANIYNIQFCCKLILLCIKHNKLPLVDGKLFDSSLVFQGDSNFLNFEILTKTVNVIIWGIYSNYTPVVSLCLKTLKRYQTLTGYEFPIIKEYTTVIMKQLFNLVSIYIQPGASDSMENLVLLRTCYSVIAAFISISYIPSEEEVALILHYIDTELIQETTRPIAPSLHLLRVLIKKSKFMKIFVNIMQKLKKLAICSQIDRTRLECQSIVNFYLMRTTKIKFNSILQDILGHLLKGYTQVRFSCLEMIVSLIHSIKPKTLDRIVDNFELIFLTVARCFGSDPNKENRNLSGIVLKMLWNKITISQRKQIIQMSIDWINSINQHEQSLNSMGLMGCMVLRHLAENDQHEFDSFLYTMNNLSTSIKPFFNKINMSNKHLDLIYYNLLSFVLFFFESSHEAVKNILDKFCLKENCIEFLNHPHVLVIGKSLNVVSFLLKTFNSEILNDSWVTLLSKSIFNVYERDDLDKVCLCFCQTLVFLSIYLQNETSLSKKEFNVQYIVEKISHEAVTEQINQGTQFACRKILLYWCKKIYQDALIIFKDSVDIILHCLVRIQSLNCKSKGFDLIEIANDLLLKYQNVLGDDQFSNKLIKIKLDNTQRVNKRKQEQLQEVILTLHD